MSKELSKKMLAEALIALDNNDLSKATRLFQHHWNSVAKAQFALMESEDEDFGGIDDLGNDFEEEVASEAGSDKEEKYNQLLIVVDELEDKFPSEMSEETQAKFDDLRNKIDELKLATEGDDVDMEECSVIIEDLKADFEVAGELSEEVNGLFDEIQAGVCGEEADAEEIEDAEEGEAAEEAEETEEVEETESTEGEPVLEAEDALDYEEPAEETEEVPAEEGELEAEEPKAEDESEDLDIIYDAKKDAEALMAKLDELEANESAEEEGEAVEECWSNVKLPRNKLQNEEEGVKKQGMKFGKAKADLKSGNQMGVSKTVSAGKSAEKKVKVDGYENKGAKSWTKVAKPENKAASAKSVIGK